MNEFEDGSSWICPYCNRDVTITEKNVKSNRITLAKISPQESLCAHITSVTCPNKKCEKMSLYARICTINEFGIIDETKKTWRLLPASRAKRFPDYVPPQIREDYEQACLIRDLSPKAAAALSRRCIQGIIRDFWSVAKSRLIDEIDAIKPQVQPKIWEAIDAVRGIGTIGAHMEKDVNIIIDVVPNEVQLLINLIETLIEDWYIAKHNRDANADAVIDLAKTKGVDRKEKSD